MQRQPLLLLTDPDATSRKFKQQPQQQPQPRCHKPAPHPPNISLIPGILHPALPICHIPSVSSTGTADR